MSKTLANLTGFKSDKLVIFTDVPRDVCSVDAEELVLLVKARAQRNNFPSNGHQQYLLALLDIASELAGTRVQGFVVPATGAATDLIMMVKGAFNGFSSTIIDVFVVGDDQSFALAG